MKRQSRRHDSRGAGRSQGNGGCHGRGRGRQGHGRGQEGDRGRGRLRRWLGLRDSETRVDTITRDTTGGGDPIDAAKPTSVLKESSAARTVGAWTIRVDPETCNGCGACAVLCPTDCITMAKGIPRIGVECVICGVCVEQCPEGALSVVSPAGQNGE